MEIALALAFLAGAFAGVFLCALQDYQREVDRERYRRGFGR
jgi:uncharacterized protein involved in exopolysaccharide biosynthesis